jgi:hypothetical protein
MRVLPFTTTGGCWSVRVSLWQLRKMKVVLGDDNCCCNKRGGWRFWAMVVLEDERLSEIVIQI